MKEVIKQFIPPIFVKGYHSFFNRIKPQPPSTDNLWKGDYKTWADAKKESAGYDSIEIMEKCKSALLKVKSGEAKYERDSVLFSEIEYSWPLLAMLQQIAIERNNELSVLDFGGSFGSTYFQNLSFLKNLKKLNWHIVEQSLFVDEGKKYFENDQLRFFHTIEESLNNQKPDVLILSGVLQYVEQPYLLLRKFLALEIPYIIIDRTAFIEGSTDILTIQQVPEVIYKASYPAWFFGIERLRDSFGNYEVVSSFSCHEGFTTSLDNGKVGTYKGFILKLKL